MSLSNKILLYINYLLKSKTAHGVHSPFVYQFITELLESRNEDYYQFKELDKIRKQLSNNKSVIEVTDFGAGSKVFKDNKRKISDIVKHGISKKKYSELYFKMVNFYNVNTIVELGTSLGLNTLYFAKANSKAKVYTIEGCKELYKFSNDLFSSQKCCNIKSINNTFDNAFADILKEITGLDFLYVDGNHQYEPTMRYFKMALEKKHENSIFVFDDINWNEGMQKAWEEIKSNTEVTLSLDLFYVGILFFRKEQKEKEHFVLKY